MNVDKRTKNQWLSYTTRERILLIEGITKQIHLGNQSKSGLINGVHGDFEIVDHNCNDRATMMLHQQRVGLNDINLRSEQYFENILKVKPVDISVEWL